MTKTTAIVFSILFPLLFARPLCAQTNDAPPRHKGRYLFIVETSTAMRKRSDNVFHTIDYLINRRLTNEWTPDDNIALWTFDNELHAGKFPVQFWREADSRAIVQRMTNFLSQQPLTKDPKPGTLMEPLARLFRNSERITVFMISSGTVPFHGTPYDLTLNESYQRNQVSLKKKNLPFVTAFRGWHGRHLGGSVAWQPWPIDLPNFPPDPEIVMTNKLEPIAPAFTTNRNSLIVIGEKPEPGSTVAEPAATAPVTTAEPTTAPSIATPEPVTAPSAEVPSAAPQGSNANLQVETPPAPTQVVAITLTTPVRPESAPAPAETAAPLASVAPPAIEPPAQKTPEPITPTAPAAPQKTSITLIAAAVGLLIVAVILFWLIVRRRGASQKSLITRSMERDRQ